MSVRAWSSHDALFVPTVKSDVDHVVADTGSWELEAVFCREASPDVERHARNGHIELTISDECLGISHVYVPHFLVRRTNDTTALVGIKGHESDQDRTKH
jgi:type III restriction enzyme